MGIYHIVNQAIQTSDSARQREPKFFWMDWLESFLILVAGKTAKLLNVRRNPGIVGNGNSHAAQ